MRAIQGLPTWQGLVIFQKSLRPFALLDSSLSIGRVNLAIAAMYPDLIR